MNDKARHRAHDIYFKILEFLRCDFTGIVSIKITILKGCITRATTGIDQQDIIFGKNDGENIDVL